MKMRVEGLFWVLTLIFACSSSKTSELVGKVLDFCETSSFVLFPKFSSQKHSILGFWFGVEV